MPTASNTNGHVGVARMKTIFIRIICSLLFCWVSITVFSADDDCSSSLDIEKLIRNENGTCLQTDSVLNLLGKLQDQSAEDMICALDKLAMYCDTFRPAAPKDVEAVEIKMKSILDGMNLCDELKDEFRELYKKGSSADINEKTRFQLLALCDNDEISSFFIGLLEEEKAINLKRQSHIFRLFNTICAKNYSKERELLASINPVTRLLGVNCLLIKYNSMTGTERPTKELLKKLGNMLHDNDPKVRALVAYVMPFIFEREAYKQIKKAYEKEKHNIAFDYSPVIGHTLHLKYTKDYYSASLEYMDSLKSK